MYLKFCIKEKKSLIIRDKECNIFYAINLYKICHYKRFFCFITVGIIFILTLKPHLILHLYGH